MRTVVGRAPRASRSWRATITPTSAAAPLQGRAQARSPRVYRGLQELTCFTIRPPPLPGPDGLFQGLEGGAERSSVDLSRNANAQRRWRGRSNLAGSQVSRVRAFDVRNRFILFSDGQSALKKGRAVWNRNLRSIPPGAYRHPGGRPPGDKQRSLAAARRRDYSIRRATIGSSRVARQAGTRLASRTRTARPSDAPANATTSSGCTS
jgi:hypothetical protein